MGSYAVVLDYAVPGELAGQEIVIRAGEQTLKVKLTSTGGWGKWQLKRVGQIEISQADLTVRFAPAKVVKGEDLLDLRAIQLIPVSSPRLNDLKTIAASAVENLPGDRRQLGGNQPVPIAAAKDVVFTLLGKSAAIFGAPMTLVPGSDKNHPEPAIDGWMQRADRAEWQLLNVKAGRYDVLARLGPSRRPVHVRVQHPPRVPHHARAAGRELCDQR